MMTDDLLLKFLNSRLKTRYHSLQRLIYAYPESILYIKEPTLEQYTSFFNSISKNVVEKDAFEKIIVAAITKFPELKESDSFLNSVLAHPNAINILKKTDKIAAENLFIKVIYYQSKVSANMSSEPLISLIKNPTFKMRFFSVKVDPKSLEFIKNPSKRIIVESVKRRNKSIQLVANPTKDIKEFVIKENVKNLKYINNQTKEDIQLAFSLNNNIAEYVSPKLRTAEVFEASLKADKSLKWLNFRNIEKYNFTMSEYSSMIEHGSKDLLGLLYLCNELCKIELESDLVEKLNEKLEIVK